MKQMVKDQAGISTTSIVNHAYHHLKMLESTTIL